MKIARWRIAFLLGLATASGSATFALTASNTVPPSRAGSGSGAISVFTVSAQDYFLNDTTPQNLDSVTWTVSPAASARVVSIKKAAQAYTCTNTAGAVSCPTTAPQATVAASAAGAPTFKFIAAD